MISTCTGAASGNAGLARSHRAKSYVANVRIDDAMALFGPREQVTLKVTGMHCGNCTQKVGDALKAVAGVVTVNVDLVFHRANVTYDPEKVTVDALVASVETSGYAAQRA